MYNEKDPQSLEKYSSAVTLSDMEVFIFPELMFSLFLANCMSPSMWKWKNDPWFNKIDSMKPLRRMHRLKQYIMDHFSFNLDLDTWGLTTKEKELSRFSSFINESILSGSNALFGYEGDKYYFDIDIRRHFGLDKYTTEVIPYWKTETLEAMEAFRFKEGYPQGAGECVSLAALYAASSFVIGALPLDAIYLLATPLHSQNFIDIDDGIITNNRRIVTKPMWSNGTEISAKARRALENERITIVAHHTGYIHTVYDTATINLKKYNHFSDKIRSYLKTDVDFSILANFLRQNQKLQCCFQIAHLCCGKPRYIEAEKVFHYEHSSKSRVGDPTQQALLHEIEEDEFYTAPLQNRLMLDELEKFFKNTKVDLDNSSTVDTLKSHLCHRCFNVEEVIKDLKKFCHVEPRLPSTDKKWENLDPIDLEGVQSAEEVRARLEPLRATNETVDLAFTAFRDLKASPWKPFLKAAIERNPVIIDRTNTLQIDECYTFIQNLENESIYPGDSRLAQPDEIVNFGRGDGIEKAIALVAIIKERFPQENFTLDGDSKNIVVKHSSKEYTFATNKSVPLPGDSDFVF